MTIAPPLQTGSGGGMRQRVRKAPQPMLVQWTRLGGSTSEMHDGPGLALALIKADSIILDGSNLNARR